MPPLVTADWQSVKDTAVALQSISEAARRHGVSIDAACQRAKREAWPVGRRPMKAITEAKQAAQAAVTLANPNAVRTVITTSAAVSDVLSEDREQTKISLSKAARTMAKEAETAGLGKAKSAHEVAKLWAITHGVGSADGNQTVNLLCQNVENLQIKG